MVAAEGDLRWRSECNRQLSEGFMNDSGRTVRPCGSNKGDLTVSTCAAGACCWTTLLAGIKSEDVGRVELDRRLDCRDKNCVVFNLIMLNVDTAIDLSIAALICFLFAFSSYFFFLVAGVAFVQGSTG